MPFEATFGRSVPTRHPLRNGARQRPVPVTLSRSLDNEQAGADSHTCCG